MNMATYLSDLQGPTYLYRIYDADDALLYIGITRNPAGHLSKHACRPWGNRIDSVSYDKYPSRRAALDAERHAIETEGPLHNITHQVADDG